MARFKEADDNQKRINEHRPFEGEQLKELHSYYRIGLTWSSNAVEGNTLTESETKVLIEDGLTVSGKPFRDALEATSHVAAYDYMATLVSRKEISVDDIKTIHRIFYEPLDKDSAGVYRTVMCFITGSSYPVSAIETIESDMNSLGEWMKSSRSRYHPIEFAALLHKQLVFIHPFRDGNGRTARLVMNLALYQAGFLPAVIAPVHRHEYVQSLEKAHRTDRDFVSFICDRVIDSQCDMMRLLHIPIPVPRKTRSDLIR